MRKCEYCKKKLTYQKRFCSRRCHCISNGYKASITNKRNKTGAFHDKKLQSNAGKIGGRIAAKINKKNKSSVWNIKIQKMGGKIGGKIAGYVSQKTLKKLNKGFYNSEIQRKNGIKGGLACQIVFRHNHRNLKYNNQYYDSKPEIEISICLKKQYNYKPIERKTLHIIIGNCEYDYLFKNLKLFIEKHSFWRISDNYKDYYKNRRKNLNKNGYKDYNLIVFK